MSNLFPSSTGGRAQFRKLVGWLFNRIFEEFQAEWCWRIEKPSRQAGQFNKLDLSFGAETPVPCGERSQ